MGKRQDRAIWLDYLRGFITVLVVAHHSSLAPRPSLTPAPRLPQSA